MQNGDGQGEKQNPQSRTENEPSAAILSDKQPIEIKEALSKLP